MEDLLGDFDMAPIATSSRSRRTREEPVRKSRRFSPPLKSRSDRPRVKFEPETPSKSMMRSSPPPMPNSDDDFDDDLIPNDYFDDDIQMGNMPEPPSSPTLKTIRRKTGAMALDDNGSEDDEDDDLAMMEVQGFKGTKHETVNMSASRPIPRLEEKPKPPPTKTPDIDASTWKNVTANLNVKNSSANESAGFGKLHPRDALEDDGTLRFFWLDYTEVHGSLCLFGKVKVKGTQKYVSCFVKVDGLMRNLYFLPREHRMCRHTLHNGFHDNPKHTNCEQPRVINQMKKCKWQMFTKRSKASCPNTGSTHGKQSLAPASMHLNYLTFPGNATTSKSFIHTVVRISHLVPQARC